jgi:hypothetical protein
MPRAFGTARLATSTTSVVPVAGVQRLDDEYMCAMTSMVFATVVITLGAVKLVVEIVVSVPAFTLIGVVLSTPVKARIPPALPVFAEKFHW